MCDEFTARDEAAFLSRRQFAALGGGALVGAMLSAPAPAVSAEALAEGKVTIRTADGTADAFFVHPAQGRHPGVVMWPDVAGLRDAYKTMARQLASAGYAVLAVNQYYRSAPAPILETMAQWRTPQGQAKLKPMIAAISAKGTLRDAQAFVAWLDHQPAVDTARKLGTCGYCMGGPYAVRTAVAAPARVGAAASLHGASLVTPDADSPHRQLGLSHARFLFAIARGDDARAPGDKEALRAAAAAAHRPAEIEVYPAEHGWCTLDAPVYDKAQAERAWGRMLALFKTL